MAAGHSNNVPAANLFPAARSAAEKNRPGRSHSTRANRWRLQCANCKRNGRLALALYGRAMSRSRSMKNPDNLRCLIAPTSSCELVWLFRGTRRYHA